MKIIYIGVFMTELAAKDDEAIELVKEQALDGFNYFTRSSISQFATFCGGQIAKRTRVGQQQSVEEKEYLFHAYSQQPGVCGLVISDVEYPNLVAHSLLKKVIDGFHAKYPRSAYIAASRDSPKLSYPELADYIKKYQDPQQADSIMKIQKELDETKIVLHKTIESVLERGEKIDTLVAKSDGLSAQSKMFYTQAKKQNSCCLVM